MTAIEFVTKYLSEPIEDVVKQVAGEFQHTVKNRILEYQVEEVTRNAYIKTLLHRIRPVPLYDVYVHLNLKEYDFLNRRDDRYEKAVASIMPVTNEVIEAVSVSKLLKERKNITVIGDAGSGKSTLIKHLFINCIHEEFKIPLKIDLRYLNRFEGDLFGYIKENVIKLFKISEIDSIIERMLNSGKFLIFLDGFDEVKSSKREEIIDNINSFVRTYGMNNYILSSRPYLNVELLPKFINLEIDGLDNQTISDFIFKQLGKNKNEVARSMIDSLNRDYNVHYKGFLSNPLLLSMFILTYETYSDLPKKRSEYFEQVTSSLFYLHDSISKLSFKREVVSKLSKEQVKDILQIFSFLSFWEERYSFDDNYLFDQFEIIKLKKNIVFKNDELLEDLLISIAIFKKEGGEYCFAHRSLQEYFACCYLSSISIENKALIYDKMISRFTESLDEFSHIAWENLLTQIYEMDFEYYSKYFTIPFLKKFEPIVANKKSKVDSLFDELRRSSKDKVDEIYLACESQTLSLFNSANSVFIVLLPYVANNENDIERLFAFRQEGLSWIKVISTAADPENLLNDTHKFYSLIENYVSLVLDWTSTVIEDTEKIIDLQNGNDRDLIDMLI